MSKSKFQPPNALCMEKGIVVWYEGGEVSRESAQQVRVDTVYNDGKTIDITQTVNGVEYRHPAVPHRSRLRDTQNPLSPEALKLRGCWDTLDNHYQLWQAAQVERMERAEAREAAEKDAAERSRKLREAVVKAASEPNANFEQVAVKFGVTEADVRDWSASAAMA
jgi:hypothetical protein